VRKHIKQNIAFPHELSLHRCPGQQLSFANICLTDKSETSIQREQYI